MTLNSIDLCSPPGKLVWLTLKSGANKLGETGRIWEKPQEEGWLV